MVPHQVVSDNDLLKYSLLNRARLSASGCWVWTGYFGTGGYGMMGHNGKNCRAHRISYEAFIGPIPKGMVVRHSCDNPACINPNHLSLGTQKENVADRQSRGRGHKLKGEFVGTSKLTADQVSEIKSSKLSLKELSEKYGIDRSNAWAIRAGLSWKHLNPNTSH